MSRLTWIERDHGWRAGPYEIELVAPQLWVCSRRRRDGTAVVEFTGGSLAALKERVEVTSRKREDVRRISLNLGVFVVGVGGAAYVAGAGVPNAPLFVVGLSIVALVSAIRAIDRVVARSWESLSATYQ